MNSPRSILDSFLASHFAARLGNLSHELQIRMLRCLRENRGASEDVLISRLEDEYGRILAEKG